MFLGVKTLAEADPTCGPVRVDTVTQVTELQKHKLISLMAELEVDCTSVVQFNGQVVSIEHLPCARQLLSGISWSPNLTFLFSLSCLSHLPTRA